MNVVQVFETIIVCFFYFDSGESFEPFFSVASAAVGYILESTICRFDECCIDEYIPRDLKLFEDLLKDELHGQHLAVEIVLNALKHHIGNANPEKALAMSFHGSSGTGKNLMVNLIVDALYQKGEKSNYVHYYNGHSDYHLEKSVVQYQRQIQEEITKHIRSCPRSIFIFDKVDHMPAGVLEVLIPFLDHNPKILDVNPNQAIFIFLSNIGAALIEEKLISVWKGGTKREDTQLKDFEALLVKSAFTGQGGFHGSDITNLGFMDYYVPFLPLEEAHVRKCVDAAFEKKNFKPRGNAKLTEMVDKAITYMTFGPPPHNLYSESGCKRVNSKVSIVIEHSKWTTNPNA